MVAAVLLLWGGGGLRADVLVQEPPDTDEIDTDGDGIVDNDNVFLHMSAGDGFVTMADGRSVYCFGFGDVTGHYGMDAIMAGMMGADFPGPTIVVREGQNLYLTLTNVGMMIRPDLFDPHTVHWHGFPNAASIFDGVPDASVSVNMMSSFTYFYRVVEPGTYMWHCHVEATEHMEMGMLAQLYVEPVQNMLPDGTELNGFTHQEGYRYAYNDGDGSSYYDVDYPLQVGGFDLTFHDASREVQPLPFALLKNDYPLLNGRGYPDTIRAEAIVNENGRPSQKHDALIVAEQGDRVLLRLSNLSVTDYYTVTALGIPMHVIGRGARLLRGPTGEDTSYMTSAVTLGGGEAMDVMLETADVPVGRYFFYTTNMHYLANYSEDYGGVMTEIVIVTPGGDPPAGPELPPLIEPWYGPVPEPGGGSLAGDISLTWPFLGARVPADEAPTFTWDTCDAMLTSFELQVSTSDEFPRGRGTRSYDVDGMSFQPVQRDWRTMKMALRSLDPDLWMLYWQVTSDSGANTVTSPAGMFHVDLGTRTLTGPDEGEAVSASGVSPTFTWTDTQTPWQHPRGVMGKYILQLADTPDFDNRVYTPWRRGTSDQSYQIPARLWSRIARLLRVDVSAGPVEIYWRVVAQDSDRVLQDPGDQIGTLMLSQ
jgi:hypothetical protein